MANDAARNDDTRPPLLAIGPVLWVVVVACVLVELALIAADNELIGSRLWRSNAYQYGGFWAGLVDDWRPNYPAQPWLMFFSYAFLHAGVFHLIGNIVTLFALAPYMRERVSELGLFVVYGFSALGGGAAFALLSDAPQVMVGASGAIFGLIGALLTWGAQERAREGTGQATTLRAIAVLIAANVAMWLLLGGVLAWETHLGGFIAGAIAALLWEPDADDEVTEGPGQ